VAAGKASDLHSFNAGEKVQLCSGINNFMLKACMMFACVVYNVKGIF